MNLSQLRQGADIIPLAGLNGRQEGAEHQQIVCTFGVASPNAQACIFGRFGQTIPFIIELAQLRV